MGVPKFFRYISERYPCLSELVKEYQIPEFDNLYLDMNGIIHMCSHPDDNDPHFRITEEKIFTDIFHYIEILFRMIKPHKVFFMAIDGVAPRAKMNQQRGRRFRSAKDAEKSELRAKEKGEELPSEERFDSNCITPGTVFMAKLHEQLKYFVVNKITNDKLWNKCKIILSGHETPGEGEHKIMDYIRYIRAQPGYDPNTRHCLYGLDADLMMLGLCTHEPHFSLLREEVLFGKKSTKRKSSPEQITFFLLHLSLMREYLELEFISVKDNLPFEYNFEKIIDDWVLMGFLVGNDFIPHLPNLHIANGALPLLYNAYMRVLPSLDGYINENGHLHLDRFEKFMESLKSVDMDHFSEQYADLQYFESKTGRRPNEKERTSYLPKKMEEWKPDDDSFSSFLSLEPEYRKPMDSGLAELIKATDDICLKPSQTNLDALAAMSADAWEELDDAEGASDIGSGESVYHDADEDSLLNAEFKLHKKDYYMNKLQYEQVTPEVLRDQAECYVRAIQWNLHYYYNSVCSWSWFYPHHYAPFISDIRNFKNFKFDFQLGNPFRPYEQLLAVLPAASKSLLPEVYHKLMTSDESTIKDYYPEEFQTDLNGKRQEWEAVVCIPFIDENNLLDAMAPCNLQLTHAEVSRNTHGPMLSYKYTDTNLGEYDAPEYFPRIRSNNAECIPIYIEDIRVPIDKLVKGAYPGVKMDIYYPGFPTMKHLNYTASLEKAKVKVFEQPSRGDNMILIIKQEPPEPIEDVAKSLLGKCVFVGWPHLVEALVVSVSNKEQKYLYSSEGDYNIEDNRANNLQQNWDMEKRGIIDFYTDRLGIEVGDTKIMVHVKVMIGRKYVFTAQGRVNLEKQWAPITSAYPLQTVVRDIKVYDEKYTTYRDISDVFKEGSQCFMLGQPHYGAIGTVKDSKESLVKGRVKVSLKIDEDPDLQCVKEIEKDIRVKYMNIFTACSRLGVSKNLLSRITGTILVIIGAKTDMINEDASKMNIGLNLKFNKKNEEIPGYTKKDKIWLYSQKTLDLVQDYMEYNPKLFQYLNKHTENDNYFEYDIFPEDAGSGTTVKEIVEWLKKQPYYSVERQQCGSLTLEADVVKALEKVIDDYDKEKKSKILMMQVKPHLLYKPDIQLGNLAPDSTTTYHLYDRVINVRESYTVPFGHTGTVIGIHNSHPTAKAEDILYDVLFDKPFAGGLALNCSPNRGYRMSRIALVNKSHGTRVMEQKTGKAGQLIQQLSGQTQQQASQPTQWRQNQSHSSPSQQPNYPSHHSQSNSAFASWNQSKHQYNQQNYNYPTNSPPQQSNQLYNNGNKYANGNKNNAAQYYKPAASTVPSQRHHSKGQSESSDKTDFMPTFGGSTTSKHDGSQKVETMTSDTEYLKKILNINENPIKNEVQTEKPKRDNEEFSSKGMTSVELNVQDMFAHASKLSNLPQPPTPAPTRYSLQLLSHYQSKGLGCPHYKYFESPDGTQYAQLLVPFTNELIFGTVAADREMACESVAKEVLMRLEATNDKDSDSSFTVLPASNPVQFPIPPAQWRQTDNMPGWNSAQVKSPKHSTTSPRSPAKHDSSAKDKSSRRTNAQLYTHPNAKCPFVPLQAVKNARVVKSADGPNSNKKTGNILDTATNENKPGDINEADIKQGPAKEQTHAQKPRRERKMRIAANFSGAK